MGNLATPEADRGRTTANGARWSNLRLMGRGGAAAVLSGANGRHYVYVLCKPEGTPFYVGKGVGRRCFQHEADAWSTVKVSHKLNVIRSIRRAGGEVAYVIDGIFETEADAHARERELIALYGRHDQGRGPLTNQLDGGEGPANPSAEVQARHAASLGGDAEDPERRVAKRFLAGIAGGQDSVPIKPWSTLRARAHLLRPSPGKAAPRPTPRMAKAIAASAIANGVVLEPGALIPRRLVIDGVECAIENGCGGDMIAAGMVEAAEPRSTPLAEHLILTTRGFSTLVEQIGRQRLVDFGVLEP